jgi:hypothetical protein
MNAVDAIADIRGAATGDREHPDRSQHEEMTHYSVLLAWGAAGAPKTTHPRSRNV